MAGFMPVASLEYLQNLFRDGAALSIFDGIDERRHTLRWSFGFGFGHARMVASCVEPDRSAIPLQLAPPSVSARTAQLQLDLRSVSGSGRNS